MELKYYLRGIGLGIIVTAVIMGFALPNERTMTDGQVRERARELGMIESTVLAGNPEDDAETEDDAKDNSEENASVEIPESGQEATDEKDTGRIGQIQTAADAVQTDSNEKNVDSGTESADTGTEDTDGNVEGADGSAESMSSNIENTKSDAGSFTVTINSGDGSDTASRKLAAAGAVSSASNFDDFLCAGGYDKRIRPGIYSIPANASDEQIARIITGQE